MNLLKEHSIAILISTSNDRIGNLREIDTYPNIHYVIVHQIFPSYKVASETKNVCEILEKRDDITYVCVQEKGLSKSRNRALNVVKSDYALIADDDIEFNYQGIREIIEMMSRDGVAVASGMHQFFSGKMAKNYKSKERTLNRISAASISSVDMVLNVRAIREQGIYFDESFGLGTNRPSGEEYIFVNDAINAGLKAKFYPITLARHPDEVSGHDFFSSPEKTIAKREMFVRCFPQTHFMFRLLFWIKKLPIVIRNKRFLMFTRNILWS